PAGGRAPRRGRAGRAVVRGSAAEGAAEDGRSRRVRVRGDRGGARARGRCRDPAAPRRRRAGDHRDGRPRGAAPSGGFMTDPSAMVTAMRTHTCGELRLADAGDQVALCGWVAHRRDHGGVTFIDLRDREGVMQIVFHPDDAPVAHAAAQELRGEWVVRIMGVVRERPPGMANVDLATGAVEVVVTSVEVLSRAETPPFVIEDRIEADELLRLEYRYLDLRRPEMTRALRLRHEINRTIREHMDPLGFLEVETPVLTTATPEGARDFLVPSRMFPGSFYALPQSPQQLKQLLKVAAGGGVIKGLTAPRGAAVLSRKELDKLVEDAKGRGAAGLVWIAVEDGRALRSPVDKFLSDEERNGILDRTGAVPGDLVCLVGDRVDRANVALDGLRRDLAARLDLISDERWEFVWYFEPPLFDWSDDENKWVSNHHPFTAPLTDDR